MRRFFCRIPKNNVLEVQEFIDTNIGIDVVTIEGECRSYNGEEPWDFCYSSGILDDNQFTSLAEYVNGINNTVFINWDSMNWSEIDIYYQNLYNDPEQINP